MAPKKNSLQESPPRSSSYDCATPGRFMQGGGELGRKLQYARIARGSLPRLDAECPEYLGLLGRVMRNALVGMVMLRDGVAECPVRLGQGPSCRPRGASPSRKWEWAACMSTTAQLKQSSNSPRFLRLPVALKLSSSVGRPLLVCEVLKAWSRRPRPSALELSVTRYARS